MHRPTSLEQTHEELLGLLSAAQRLPGKTGVVAEKLAKYLQSHMEREDEYALPLLGLLPSLVVGRISAPQMRQTKRLYSRMREEYPRMTKEHREIGKLNDQLKNVGTEEGHLTAIRFAEKLERHSHDEEEILYPAALLAGKLASESKKPRQSQGAKQLVRKLGGEV